MSLLILPKSAGVIIHRKPPIPQQPAILVNDIFTAIDNQTIFTLSTVAIAQPILLSVNGVGYEQDVDYSFSDPDVTWLDTLFSLVAGDIVQIFYQSSIA